MMRCVMRSRADRGLTLAAVRADIAARDCSSKTSVRSAHSPVKVVLARETCRADADLIWNGEQKARRARPRVSLALTARRGGSAGAREGVAVLMLEASASCSLTTEFGLRVPEIGFPAESRGAPIPTPRAIGPTGSGAERTALRVSNPAATRTTSLQAEAPSFNGSFA